MAKPILKWRRIAGSKGIKSGPFEIRKSGVGDYWMATCVGWRSPLDTYENCKFYCDVLASRIIAATKGRHGE